MMKKILLFLLLSMAQLHAQNPPNQIAISYGAAHLARQDLVFSPMIHRNLSGVNLGLNYTRQANLFQSLNLSFQSFGPHLSEAYDFSEHGETKTAAAHQFYFFDLDYLIGRSRGENAFRFSVGGALMADVQTLNYVYGRIGNFGYYSGIGLGVFASMSYSPNAKNQMGLSLQLPLLTWIARSPYSINDDEYIENTASQSDLKTFFAFLEDGQLASWDKLQYLDLDLSYSHDLSQRWSLGVLYRFSFLHSLEPRPLLSFQNTLKLQIALKF